MAAFLVAVEARCWRADSKADCHFEKTSALGSTTMKPAETSCSSLPAGHGNRRLREKLTIRDIGIWSHYGGDASQPLHVRCRP